MNDDELSNLIRSGAKHSVSVSEHTGNAKTPQNRVTSSEEDTEAHKSDFEADQTAALAAEIALAGALSENAEHGTPHDTATDNNYQKLSADSLDENHQPLTSDKGPAPNRQGLPTEAMLDNQQVLVSDNIPANQQTFTGDQAAQDNRQTIATNANTPNVQSIATDGDAANIQVIDKGTTPSANVQAIPTHDSDSNKQKLVTLGVQDNQQSLDPNEQGRHRQGVDDGKIQPHFEPLPSGTVERKKVDFPTSDQPSISAKPATTSVKPEAARQLAPKQALAPRPPKTAAELEEVQRQRDKLNDAFHSRMAGIKQNVEELNDRLTDIEQKAQKDDTKLIKGNPNAFKVGLD